MSEQYQRPSQRELRRRNRKAAKRRQIRLTVIAVALSAFLVYITGIYGASLAYLGDFVSSGMVYLQFGGGFPVATENQTYKQAQKMGSSLCVLDGDSLDFYSPTADKVYSYHHSMQNPAIYASSKRVAIYNSGDTSVKILNAHDVLFSQETQYDIMHASLSDNNYLALTTKSQSYNGEVKVYNSQMKEMFTWQNAKSFPLQSFLSPKAKSLAVSSVFGKDGKLQSQIYLINTDDGSEKFVLEQEDNIPLGISFIKEDKLAVFYTGKAVIVNTDDGSVAGTLDYDGKNLLSYDIKNSHIAVSLGDYDGLADSKIYLFDLAFNKLFGIDPNEKVSRVKITSQRIFLLAEEKILQYNLKGEFCGETAAQHNAKDIVDYGGCVAINGDSLVKIEKIDKKD